MTPRTSRSSKASRRSVSVRVCTSARPGSGVCTTSSTRSWTTRWTRRSPATATTVTVTIHPDNSITVIDNGRGIPVAKMEKEDKSALEVDPHRPARRRQVRRRRRLQGLRRPARRGRVRRQRPLGGARRRRSSATATRGVSSTPAASRRARSCGASRRTRPARRSPSAPDDEIFETLDFEYSTLEQRLRETAFLTRGLRISITDERGEDKKHKDFYSEGGIEDFVRYINENKDTFSDKVIFLEGENEKDGAVEVALQWNAHLSGVGVLVREQHQHARGRLAPLRLPLGADRHAEPLRAVLGPAQGQGQGARGRGHPRGPDGRHLREADRPAVRGPDEDQARQPGHAGLRRLRGQRQAGGVPRGEPQGGRPDRPQGGRRLTRPRRGPQGPRHRAQERPGRHGPAGQARRLHGQGTGDRRDLHRRG